MKKPISRILIINDEKLILREFVKGLNAAAKSMENPFGIIFSGVTTAHEALQSIEQDGDIQALVVDDRLYTLKNTAKHARDLQMTALDLVQKITYFRPELNIYILIAQEQEDEVVDALFSETVDGYFYREERDYRGMYRILNAQLQEKARTPFYDQLKNYVLMAKDAWHTPGHSSGDSLRDSPWVSDFYEFIGEHIFRADLSVSVPMLDSLMEPTGVIAEAQKIASKAFGAQRTFFATNGTSTANKVIFQTLLAPGNKLLLDRNCHKSVHHGVVLSGAHPIYLDSSVNKKFNIYGPVPKQTLFDAIEKHHDAQALILTSCTYDGLRYDLPPIIQAAHAKGIKVIIDEAWYGFARFHPAFRPTALEAGADYATQSTHKVLSAFSQSSMIHVNDPDFNEHIFRENFNMHTSTSPQYSMIASLDISRKQIVLEGYKLLSRTLELAKELRAQINSTGVFQVLELSELLPDEIKQDNIQLDSTKVTVDISRCGFTVEELIQELFERFNIQVEKSTFNTLTLLLTIGTTRSKVSRLYDALMRIARENRAPRRLYQVLEPPHFTELKYLPRDAFYCGGELVPLLDEQDKVNPNLNERVCADQITPYPPGIPVLVPGQMITKEVIQYLANMLRSQKRIEVHGIIYDGYLPCLRILTIPEEKNLKKLVSVDNYK
ncbi:MAG TPA: aminotransferase class I/II-fold pyridoxal phosphate-dependent enzyme [Nitrosomonas sp.]|jgi:arginine decarboxylase|nr:aminotransferase class I/II-fold pyridoxal phosphate-dependent enzyme [Nitrosomonas sp.]MBP9870178.1 aminotransferase class I/II-fold pyridoxal phosphate-dependent enzyme [Nitrosomonas sp.]MDO8333818.1 aminotransferase class I/II-fold pyridoxal phosphate-dependent enzyme [Nitrosomonas sp.]HQV88666.1 aminotransferase class I/II-fold pyridoxal phosphate-dependent enzyme [Nitrosomonas sp.]HRB98029.1 aminotransferase class I/II-fold pyridoxal phosphate-dependent enzyme [Nitrosomonas sp.]